MTVLQNGVILGADALKQMLRELPGRVAKRVFDNWSYAQAQRMRDMAKASAPRNRRPNRKAPESARLWRSIKASRVRRLKKGVVSRSIVYSAAPRNRAAVVKAVNRAVARRVARGYTGRRRTTPVTASDLAPRARHFHLVLRGNPKTRPRRHRSGKSTGNMTVNTVWWESAARISLAMAQGEVGAQLRNAYISQMDKEMRRMTKRYL